MEEQLEQIQEFFNDDSFEQTIDSILEQYLQKTKCEFTNYQKSVFPICAAYYAILETREIEAEGQRSSQQLPGTPKQSEGKSSINDKEQASHSKNKEKLKNQQKDSKNDGQGQQSSSSSCYSPGDQPKKDSKKKQITEVSIMELRNQFYKKGQIEQLLKTMTEFSQVLQGRDYSEVIQSKLESIKRNHSLFIKFSHVLDCFYSDTEIIQKQLMQRVIWRLYLLLKEELNKDHSEVDIEQCAYLLHFICSEALIFSGKTPQSLQNNHFHNSQQSVLLNSSQTSQTFKQITSMSTIQEQVNAILLKGKLEQQIMDELQPQFTAILSSLSEKIFNRKGNNNKNSSIGQADNKSCGNSSGSDTSCLSAAKEGPQSGANLIDEEKDSELVSTASKGKPEQNSSSLLSPTNSNIQITNSFSSPSQLEKLSKLLEKEINLHSVIEEHEFLQKEEDFLQSLSTPKAKPISSMLLQQGPPGVTKDYQDSKYQNNALQPSNVQIPKKTLTFNDDISNLNLNSKLSDLERPLPSPVGPYGNQNQLGGLGETGFLQQQPLTPKMPLDIYKIPNTRNHLMLPNPQNIPTTPVSTALDNSKWINMYSKSDPTKRIEELMGKIDKEYKQKLIDEVSQIARDVYYFSKKKNEIMSNITEGIEYKVQKTVSFFQNVLEKMICDEESRNCREIVLIQLLENKNFIFSLLANCIMTTCYVKDYKGISLDLVIKQSKITSLDYWRVISNFAKFDRYMPEAIKEQLFNQEKQILLYSIWEEKDHLMQNALKNFSEDQSKNHNYEKVICKRLISHSATRVREITKVLELNEDIQERVWEALLYVYRSQLQLMNGRYVDQIIICSIYALKLIRVDLFKDKEIKFKGMISACENLLHFNYEKVKKTTNEQGESVDIISFYNKIYLVPMKQYFKSTNNLTDGYGTPNQMILNCSLRNSIPPNFINYTPLLKEELQNQMRAAMTPMTPVTQKLQATENLESPFPVNQNNFLTRKLANRQSQFSQGAGQQQNLNFGNIGNLGNLQQQKVEGNNQATKTVTVLGQNYSSASIGNINGNTEKKSSRKLNFEGEEKSNLGSIQYFDQGTPTLEQKESSPAPTDLSPKFGSINSTNSFGINQSKKFLEDNAEELRANNIADRTLKRCNSIFGIKNPNFNSDEENIPSKTSKTNTTNEGNGKNTNTKEDH